MPPPIEELFNRLAPSSVPTGGFASLRWVDERMEALSVRRKIEAIYAERNPCPPLRRAHALASASSPSVRVSSSA